MQIAQEEIDWLIYETYGLIDAAPILNDINNLVLSHEQRPFFFWMEAEGNFDNAVSFIPVDWSDKKRSVWRERLEIIRDNEHVRRIEKPYYKRRWDEQWKVGNTWQCGPPAYNQEFLDAFDWWLAEKAEWWLEFKALGGPIDIYTWAKALWDDARIQEAWKIASETKQRLENWKRLKNSLNPLELISESSYADFTAYFKSFIQRQTVPLDIPWGMPWEVLKQQGVHVPNHTKSIRGKYNVPRERFRKDHDEKYYVVKPL